MDVKQACEAASATPIDRTKLRMVYAVGRWNFDMEPIDVGEAKTRLRVEGGAALKVKVSSIMINPQTSRSKGLPMMSCESSVASSGR